MATSLENRIREWQESWGEFTEKARLKFPEVESVKANRGLMLELGEALIRDYFAKNIPYNGYVYAKNAWCYTQVAREILLAVKSGHVAQTISSNPVEAPDHESWGSW